MPDIGRRTVLGIIGVELVVIAALLTVALDVKAHARVEGLGGVNLWGYRGPVMRVKQRREIRIAVVGGNLAFGWGVAASETVAPTIRQLTALALDVRGGEAVVVTAANLGVSGLRWQEYGPRLARFSYLQPDVVCIYLDPTDHPSGVRLPSADSGVARLTGYVPMLPLVLEEKARRLNFGAGVASAAGGVLGAADRLLSSVLGAESAAPEGPPFDAISGTVSTALAVARGVVVVVPAPFSPDDTVAREPIASQSRMRYANEPRVRIVDLADFPAVADDGLRLDGRNFSVAGHLAVAEAVTPAVLELVRQH